MDATAAKSIPKSPLINGSSPTYSLNNKSEQYHTLSEGNINLPRKREDRDFYE